MNVGERYQFTSGYGQVIIVKVIGVDERLVKFERPNGKIVELDKRSVARLHGKLLPDESQVYGNDCPNGMCDV